MSISKKILNDLLKLVNLIDYFPKNNGEMFKNTVFTKLIRQRDDRRSEDIIQGNNSKC